MKSFRPVFTIAFALVAAAAAGSASAGDYDGYGAAPAATAPKAASPLAFRNGMLATAAGMTVYTFDKDAEGKSACNGACADKWSPVTAAASDKAWANYTLVQRDDGRRQWAFKGKPLYTWVADKQPGDKTGDGFGNAWHIVTQ